MGGLTKGRWPTKSIKVVLGLVENMIANANTKQLDAENLFVSHVQINKAPNGRRRTYRAHGRITPFMSHPCHVEMWAAIKDQGVAKAKPPTSVYHSLNKLEAEPKEDLERERVNNPN